MLIVDTNVLVAAIDRGDPYHRVCYDLLDRETEPLVTTAMVIAEAAYLIDRELGPQVEATIYETVTDGNLIVENLGLPDWRRIRALVVQYANLRLGGTDASLIALAERHRAERIATLNHRHFGVVRPSHRRTFTLIPEQQT